MEKVTHKQLNGRKISSEEKRRGVRENTRRKMDDNMKQTSLGFLFVYILPSLNI